MCDNSSNNDNGAAHDISICGQIGGKMMRRQAENRNRNRNRNRALFFFLRLKQKK